ncbi:hypothetical protein HQ42_08760 [Porphyromonas gulae]|uniref:MAE-28990/MAE-18760-like HEPN domain-containing protein n=1 Tax=Porphyromonas gingivicanis TaxID=266762 RepID=A0A0A2G966_9PORP|nr:MULTISPECIES: MAE_28990/MAE_18760 family HEPN-like nuclease [Porphyromonas]KGN98962.1 hypothetical protein HQ36_00240 [Porphyromonas gingivicanis]KGO02029.1 hypothetical protein HQ42_08760 [Porphyromonas gulae]
MKTTRAEYTKRLNEVTLYFETIKLLDNGDCSIICKDINGGTTEKIIDGELAKIMKANGFLLLYNLIEATIRNSISAILNSISTDKLTFKLLSDNLKKLWINQEINKTKDISKFKEKVSKLSEKILNDKLLEFSNECVNISGNIDAQRIREIAKKFGYLEPKNGRGLQTIKDKRNQLAHGEFTFSDIGKNYTSNDLIDYKSEVVTFIENVLNNVETYINAKGYKKV